MPVAPGEAADVVGIAIVERILLDFAPADRVGIRTIDAVVAVVHARRGAFRISRIAPVRVIVVLVIFVVAELPPRDVGLVLANAVDR